MADVSDLQRLGLELHARLLARSDPCVTAEVADAFLLPLVKRLRSRFSHVTDPHIIDTAAEDALLKYFRQPERYDPQRGTLLGYLLMDAGGDLKNFLRAERRVVALHPPLAEYKTQGENRIDDAEARLTGAASPVERAFARVPDPIDRELVELMMENERRTEVYAEALGVAGRPPGEQAAIVKRHKDRLKKLLRRVLGRPSARTNGEQEPMREKSLAHEKSVSSE